MLDTILRGHYKIISHLGSGGFGQTYLAEDMDLPKNSNCVVKQLKPLSHEPFVLETAKRLFDKEAEMLYSLGSHDRIPRLLAHFQEGDEFYLVQEFADGKDLNQEIGNGKRSPEAVVRALFKEVLEILVFVHERGVVHRDIKPANLIRRNSDQKIVLIDFGAVKEIGSLAGDAQGNTNLTIAIGSAGYMPIEQLNGKPRFSSDIFAVGMMGLQALTGAEPRLFTEHPETAELVWRDRLPDSSYTPQFLDILDKMIRYDFRQRYQTANEVLEAIALLPTVPDHPLATVIINGNLNNTNATIAVSPQAAHPYSQKDHPSQLHTVAYQQQAPRKSPKLWIWIAGGSILLFLVSAVLGKNSKSSTTPEITNNSPLVAPKSTTTSSPSLTGSEALLKTFSRENGAIAAIAKAIAPKPAERFLPPITPANGEPLPKSEERFVPPANVEPPIEPVRKVEERFVPPTDSVREDRSDREDRGSSSKKGGKKK